MSSWHSRFVKNSGSCIFKIFINKNITLKECERMNNLMKEMKRSLRELDLGLKGELTISSDMEDLSNSLFFDQV